MKKIIPLFTLLIIIAFSSMVYAHPGRTDENGGHYDRSTGEYHYHHGYPAHQHENGVCPYDFDDNTQHSESKVTSDVSTVENTPVLGFLAEYNIFAVILIGFICCFFVCVLVYYIFTSNHISSDSDMSEENSSTEHKLLLLAFLALYLEYNILILIYSWMADVVFKVFAIGDFLFLLSMFVWILKIFPIFTEKSLQRISHFFVYVGFAIFFLSIIPIILAAFIYNI